MPAFSLNLTISNRCSWLPYGRMEGQTDPINLWRLPRPTVGMIPPFATEALLSSLALAKDYPHEDIAKRGRTMRRRFYLRLRPLGLHSGTTRTHHYCTLTYRRIFKMTHNRHSRCSTQLSDLVKHGSLASGASGWLQEWKDLHGADLANTSKQQFNV